MGTKNRAEWDFGYGQSEYEVSFDLAPRNGELSPPDPKIPGPCNSPFRAGTRNGLQIRTPRLILGRHVKTWALGAYIPRDKRSMVKLFVFQGGKINFLDLSCQLCYFERLGSYILNYYENTADLD